MRLGRTPNLRKRIVMVMAAAMLSLCLPLTGFGIEVSSKVATGESAASLPIVIEDLYSLAVPRIKSSQGDAAAQSIIDQKTSIDAKIAVLDLDKDPSASGRKADRRTFMANVIIQAYGLTIVDAEITIINKELTNTGSLINTAQSKGANVTQSKSLLLQAQQLQKQADKLGSTDPAQALVQTLLAGNSIRMIRILVAANTPGGSPASPTPPANGGSPSPSPAPTPPTGGSWAIEQPRPWDYQPTVSSQSGCMQGEGTIFEVGAGLTYSKLSDVPWESLKGCDTVNIHYQPQPYKEVSVISSRGAKNKFIRIVGVPGPNGEMPVLDGKGAVTPAKLFSRMATNTVFDGLGIIEILPDPAKGAPYGWKPGYIEISGLDIQNANKAYTYTNQDGKIVNWNSFACGIYIERAENVVISNNHIHGNSQGLFMNSKYDEAAQSRYLLVERNYIHDNGNPGSAHEHNAYTEGVGTIYQYNYFGAPAIGSVGENIKERSVGLTFRYNFFEGGVHSLYLEDPESNASWEAVQKDAWGQLLADSVYAYGNTFVLGSGSNGWSSPWGYTLMGFGDGVPINIRGGHIYFYNNTVESKVDYGTYYFPDSILFDIHNNRNNPTVAAQNNVFYAAPQTPGKKAAAIALFLYSGKAKFDHNWISPGYLNVDKMNDPAKLGSLFKPSAPYDGSGLSNMQTNPQNDPGFVDAPHYDFHLKASSQLVNAGLSTYDPEIVKTGQLPASEYDGKTKAIISNKKQDGQADIGAFEQ